MDRVTVVIIVLAVLAVGSAVVYFLRIADAAPND